MGNVTAKVDAKSFGRTFKKMLDSPKFKQDAYDIMEETFIHAREKLLQEFNKSEITKEIEAGENANDTSELLDGYGNLFSFIGFPQGENPIEHVREYLQEYIDMNQTVRRENFWYFKISVPDEKEIAEISPMPWEEGNSWILGIEKEGISNLSHYLYGESNKSRSTMGLQITPMYRNVSFSTSPYLLHMLEEFKEEFKVA